MLFSAAFFVLGAVLQSQGSALPPGSPHRGDIVDVGYAKYLGNRAYPNTNAFLGVPYAEPPLGDRRFRAPLPLNTTRVAQETNGQVVDATQYPNSCIQGSFQGEAAGAGTEDCLKINIYAPVGAQKGHELPVLFYIHGGAYVYGNPANFRFEHWIKQSPNVVIVSVYYRLNSFGFLSTPEFSDASVDDFNIGFKDQIMALKWVKQHIDAFGGDPNKLTIEGESAGAGAVQLHLVAHEDERLFSGAIAQSVYRAVMSSPEQVKPLFSFYAARAGCGIGPVSAQMRCLRQADVAALSRAQDAALNFTGQYRFFLPVLDGQLFTETPTKSFLGGRFVQVPLIVRATTNDSVVSYNNFDQILKGKFPLLTDEDIKGFEQAYPPSDFANETTRINTATGESMLVCARVAMGEAYAKHPKVWAFRYNQPDPLQPGPGVGHAAENYILFRGTEDGPNGTTTFHELSPIEHTFSEELIAYWLSFVRSGDPNTYKLSRSPEWPQYMPDKDRRQIVFQKDPKGQVGKNGNFIETEDMKENQRCHFVISKADHEQN